MSLYVNEEPDENKEQIFEVDWNDYVAEQNSNEVLQRITASGPHKYLKVNKYKLNLLEQLAMGHRVKPTYRRTAIAKNNPRDATGRYSAILIYSETLTSGAIVDLCRSMLPWECMNAVHVDWNVGDSCTIVFGNYKGGILEIEGEKSDRRKRLWRRYDACKRHRVTLIKSGIRVSLTAFRKANVSPEFRDQFLLDDVD